MKTEAKNESYTIFGIHLTLGKSGIRHQSSALRPPIGRKSQAKPS